MSSNIPQCSKIRQNTGVNLGHVSPLLSLLSSKQYPSVLSFSYNPSYLTGNFIAMSQYSILVLFPVTMTKHQRNNLRKGEFGDSPLRRVQSIAADAACPLHWVGSQQRGYDLASSMMLTRSRKSYPRTRTERHLPLGLKCWINHLHYTAPVP